MRINSGAALMPM